MNPSARAYADRVALRGLNDISTIDAFQNNTKRRYKLVGVKSTYNWWAFNGGDTDIFVARFSWKRWFRSGWAIVIPEHIQQRIENLTAKGLPADEEQKALKELMKLKLSGTKSDANLFVDLYSVMESMRK